MTFNWEHHLEDEAQRLWEEFKQAEQRYQRATAEDVPAGRLERLRANARAALDLAVEFDEKADIAAAAHIPDSRSGATVAVDVRTGAVTVGRPSAKAAKKQIRRVRDKLLKQALRRDARGDRAGALGLLARAEDADLELKRLERA